MAGFKSAVAKFFGIQMAEDIVRNRVNEAFLLGGQYTQYDTNAPTYVKEGYLYNPIVYSIVKQRSDKAVQVPYYLKRVKDNNSRKKIKHLQKSVSEGYSPGQYTKELTLKNQAFDEDILDFPLERPNALQTWEELISLYETFMATTGNCYFYMLKGRTTNVPAAIYVLPAHLMQIVPKDNSSLMGVDSPIDHYRLIEGNQYIRFEAEDVIHIKLPNPEYNIDGSHLYGQSPLRAALRNLQSSNLNIDSNIRSALNNGAFGFIYADDPSAAFGDKQAQDLKTRLQAMDLDSRRLGKIQASGVKLGFQQIGLSAQEQEVLKLLNFDQKQIANALGWDDILLNNDQGAKYDNYQLALKGAVSRTTMPSLSLLEAALNDSLWPLFPRYQDAVGMFDFSELPEMQPDMKTLVDWLNIGVANGSYTRDEFRSMTNFTPKENPEMEAHTVNQDIIRLEEAISNDFGLNGQADL